MTKWGGKVYKKVPRMTQDQKDSWDKTRRFILDRDFYTCLRCDKHFRAQRDLSVHHLIPRSEDGTDDPKNLVTLCNSCHDFVEVAGFRTIADIVGSYDAGIIKVLVKPENGETETFTRPEWHRFVYGGARHNS